MVAENGTFYITPGVGTSTHSAVNRAWTRVASTVAVFFALVAIILSTITATPLGQATASSHTAQAGTFGIFCSEIMGSNMDSQAKWYQWLKSYPASDKDGRRLTAQEALENGLFFVNYHGEGKGDFLVKDKSDESYKEHSKTDEAKLKASRTLNNCALNSIGVWTANDLLGIANGLSGITQYIVMHTFDSNMICSDAKDTTGDCFNMLKIIGGTGANGRESANANKGGIIGALTGSLFFPLASLVFIAVGVGVFIKLAKMKIRDIFFGVLWAFIAYMVSLIMLLNPSLLAKAPLAVSNTIASCVIGAFSGGVCGTNNSGTLQENESTSDAVCRAYANNSDPSSDMQMIAGSLTCKIWKAFVLNMYAEGSFGTGFDNLDTLDKNRPTNKILTDAGLKPEDYCVNLYTEKSIDSQKNGVLTTTDNGDGNKICNLVTYQMYLETSVKSGEDTLPDTGKIDTRWYKVIDAAAANNGFWSSWSGSMSSTFNKNGIALLAIFVVVLGGLVLIVTSLYAAVYFISSIILMAFSPIFLLIGIDPDRGRRILLGFFQKVATNVMKYIASAGFLVASIAMYGGILDDIDSIPTTILFVLLITMALLMYRKEIIDLLGKVNAKGEELSSRMSDRLGRTMRGAGSGTTRMLSAGVGGAVGAKMAGGTMRSGFADAAKRDLKRSGGFVGNVARQVDRENVANRGKLKNKEQEAKQQERDAQQAAKNWQDASRGASKEIASQESRKAADQKTIDRLEGERFKKTHATFIARKDLITDAELHLERVNNNPEATMDERESAISRLEQVRAFVEFESLGERIGALEKQKSAISDPAQRKAFQNRINGHYTRMDELQEPFEEIDGRTFDDLRGQVAFNADKVAARAKFGSEQQAALDKAYRDQDEADRNIDKATAERDLYDQRAAGAHREAAEAGQRGRMYGEINDRNAAAAGRTVTAKSIDKADKKVAKARQEKGFVSKETAKKDLKAEHKRNRGKTKVTADVHIYGDQDTDLDGKGAKYDADGTAIAPPKRSRRRRADSSRRPSSPSPATPPSASTPELPALDLPPISGTSESESQSKPTTDDKPTRRQRSVPSPDRMPDSPPPPPPAQRPEPKPTPERKPAPTPTPPPTPQEKPAADTRTREEVNPPMRRPRPPRPNLPPRKPRDTK